MKLHLHHTLLCALLACFALPSVATTIDINKDWKNYQNKFVYSSDRYYDYDAGKYVTYRQYVDAVTFCNADIRLSSDFASIWDTGSDSSSYTEYRFIWDATKAGTYTMSGPYSFKNNLIISGGTYNAKAETTKSVKGTCFEIGEEVSIDSCLIVMGGADVTIKGAVSELRLETSPSQSDSMARFDSGDVSLTQLTIYGGRVIADNITTNSLQIEGTSEDGRSWVEGNLTLNSAYVQFYGTKSFKYPLLSVLGTLTLSGTTNITYTDSNGSSAARSVVLVQARSISGSLEQLKLQQDTGWDEEYSGGWKPLIGSLSLVKCGNSQLIVYTTDGFSGTYKNPGDLPLPSMMKTSEASYWVYNDRLTGEYYNVAGVNVRVDDDFIGDGTPLYWTGKTGKETLSMSGESCLSNLDIICSGGQYTANKGFSKGNATFNIEDAMLDTGSLEATMGAKVNLLNCSVADLRVTGSATVNIGDGTSVNSLTFGGGTINCNAEDWPYGYSWISQLTLNVDSKTAQNTFVGDLTLNPGSSVEINYTGKNTKPMLAVQGVLTLEDGVSVTLNTSGAAKPLAAHDFVLFQAIKLSGDVDNLSFSAPVSWTGSLVKVVSGNNSLIAYVGNAAKPAYAKPKALSGNTITFADSDTSQYINTDVRMKDEYPDALTMGSTSGKGTYELRAYAAGTPESLTFSGGWDAKKNQAKTGKAVYNAIGGFLGDSLVAVCGATVHFLSMGSYANVSVSGASTIDFGSYEHEFDSMTFAGGTVRGIITSNNLTVHFDKTTKQQNIVDGSLTLGGDITVDAGTVSISKPILAVTGGLDVSGVSSVTITAPANQSDFVLFQSRGQTGSVDSATLIRGGRTSTVNLATYSVGGYDVCAYVSNSGKTPKAIKLAACSVTLGDSSVVENENIIVYGEAGGTLLETHDLEEGTFDAVMMQSGIAKLEEGKTLSAPIISVGTGADDFNATINNNGTLDGTVEITENASVDNQGRITGPVRVMGTLHNDGSIGGEVSVARGATLRGSGSFSSVCLSSGSVITYTATSSSAPMTIGSLTLSGTTQVDIYVDSELGGEAFSCEILKAENVNGTGDFSLTLSGASMESSELVWDEETGTLTFKGQIAEQALVAAPVASVTHDISCGQAVADALWGTQSVMNAWRQSALNQYRPAERNIGQLSAWAGVLGATMNRSQMHARSGGAVVGAECAVNQSAAIGLSLGYSDGDLRSHGHNIDQSTNVLGVYTDVTRGAIGYQAYGVYAGSENKGRGDLNRSKWDSDGYGIGGRISWNHQIHEQFKLGVFAGLEYTYARQGVAAGYSDSHMHQLELPIGVSASGQFGKWVPNASIAYIGDVYQQAPRAYGYGARVKGSSPGRSGVRVSAGTAYLLSERMSLQGSYAIEAQDKATDQSANVNFRYDF